MHTFLKSRTPRRSYGVEACRRRGCRGWKHFLLTTMRGESVPPLDSLPDCEDESGRNDIDDLWPIGRENVLNRGKVKFHGSVVFLTSFFLSFCSFFPFCFESELELPSSYLTPDLGGHEGREMKIYLMKLDRETRKGNCWCGSQVP